MRRVLFPVLMTAAILLCGCGETAALENGFEEARERWSAAESLSFTAEVRAELPDSVFDCTLQCNCSGGETLVEVLAPENISGIRARMKEGETNIEYDGLILALENVAEGISPLGAMPMLADALLQGHLRSIWREDSGDVELAAAELYMTETEYALLWLNTENFVPVNMELVSGGRAVVKCKITSFTEE